MAFAEPSIFLFNIYWNIYRKYLHAVECSKCHLLFWNDIESNIACRAQVNDKMTLCRVRVFLSPFFAVLKTFVLTYTLNIASDVSHMHHSNADGIIECVYFMKTYTNMTFCLCCV